jgi:hypothetical protein
MNNLKVTTLIALLFLFCSAAQRTFDFFTWNEGTICAFIIPTIVGLIIYWCAKVSIEQAYKDGQKQGSRDTATMARCIAKEVIYEHEKLFKHERREPIKQQFQS